MKKRLGTISYNIHCNFTNYGSALQTWALHQAMERYANAHPVLVDYCPDVLRDKDPLNPMRNMWDSDEESRRMCELSMPAIRENYRKFDRFYHERFDRTETEYISENFDEAVSRERLDGFVCGSDTIFCIDEFGGFDDGYYANYPSMKGRSVAYAASFGDSHFTDAGWRTLSQRAGNFRAVGIREGGCELDFLREHVEAPVEQVMDPTLLLGTSDFDALAAPRIEEGDYILLYSRRYNHAMERYAEHLAGREGLKIIEISLRATNVEKPDRRMLYEAGVEEFLSLVKHAQHVVTNSYHGMIVAVQFRRPFVVFSREQCDSKIGFLAPLLGLSSRVVVRGNEAVPASIDWDAVSERLAQHRDSSIRFLQMECGLL